MMHSFISYLSMIESNALQYLTDPGMISRMTVKPLMELYLNTVIEVISRIRTVYRTGGKSVSVKLFSGMRGHRG